LHGKKIINRQGESQTKILVARLFALPEMRAPARVLEKISLVPNLLSRAGAGGANSRRGEIELVVKRESGVRSQESELPTPTS